MTVKIPDLFHEKFDEFEGHGLNVRIIEERHRFPDRNEINGDTMYIYLDDNKIIWKITPLKARMKFSSGTDLKDLPASTVEDMFPDYTCERCGRHTFNLLLDGEPGDEDRTNLCKQCREEGAG